MIKPCAKCHGAGRVPPKYPQRTALLDVCSACRGSGQTPVPVPMLELVS